MAKRVRFLFFIFFWWSVLTPNFINIFGVHSILGLIDEALQISLFAVWLPAVLLTKEKIIVPSYIKLCGIIALSITVASALFNTVTAWYCVQFVLIYFRPLFMILVAATFFDIDDIPLFVKSILILFAIQIVLNFTWLLHINPFSHWKGFVDISTGTFESCAATAYFCTMVIFCCFSVIGNSGNFVKLMFSKIGIIVLIAILQLYFTFTTHALPIGIASSIGFAFDKIRRMYGLVLISLIFVFVMFLFGEWERGQFHSSTKDLLSIESSMSERLARLEYSLKVNSFRLVIYGKVPEIKTRWLGAGPGMYASIVAKRSSSLYRKYHDSAVHKRFGRRYMHRSSVTGYPRSGALSLLGDIGWAGFLPMAYMNLCILWSVICFIRSRKHLTTHYPEAFVAFIPSFIFYLMMDIIWDLGTFKIFSIAFWIWAGVLLKEIQKDHLAHAKNNIRYKVKSFARQY